MTCCFFGHSDCPFGIRPIIRVQIEKMMEESAKVKFYAGNHGQFDGIRITNAILTVLRMLIVSETEFLKTS